MQASGSGFCSPVGLLDGEIAGGRLLVRERMAGRGGLIPIGKVLLAYGEKIQVWESYLLQHEPCLLRGYAPEFVAKLSFPLSLHGCNSVIM